jgi:hypothetical protein
MAVIKLCKAKGVGVVFVNTAQIVTVGAGQTELHTADGELDG